MIALLIALSALAGASPVVEPNTKVAFEPVFNLDNQELVLTGVDRRRALGRDAYAVAHYMAGDSVPSGGQTSERLDGCIAADAPKMLIFHGVYPSVPAHGIRHSWKKHFRDIGLPPREDFVNTFTEPFKKDERLYFIARGAGRLEVRHENRVVGEWNDVDLVRALWTMCLGPKTEIVNRENLARLQPAEVARRDARNTAAEESRTP